MSTPTSCEVVAAHDDAGRGFVAVRMLADRTEIRLSPADALRLAEELADVILHGAGGDVHIDLDDEHTIVVAPAEAQRLRIELSRSATSASRTKAEP